MVWQWNNDLTKVWLNINPPIINNGYSKVLLNKNAPVKHLYKTFRIRKIQVYGNSRCDVHSSVVLEVNLPCLERENPVMQLSPAAPFI